MTLDSQYEKRCQKCGDVRSYPMNVRHCVCGGLLRCTSNKSTRWSQERKAAGLCRCGEPLNGKSLCAKHLAEQIERMRKRYIKREQSGQAQAMAYTFQYEVQPTGCWIPVRNGVAIRGKLGYFSLIKGGKPVTAHRYIYERFRGPIPQGMVLDHLCVNRACVNPEHLEIVTHRENIRRSRQNKAIGPAFSLECGITDSMYPSYQLVQFHSISKLPIFAMPEAASV